MPANSKWILVLTLALAFSCARAPVSRDMEPEQLLKMACEPGEETRLVEGSVWLKASSKDASGQFPAEVRAVAPSQLKLEVTNLIGGTEAVIAVEGTKYKIDLPSKKKKSGKAQAASSAEEGQNSWGGIPLRWATDLFLGKIPCPPAAMLKDSKLKIDEELKLVVETPATLGSDPQKFVYEFQTWEGKPWAKALRWESGGALPTAVDFAFEDPEPATRSPRRWEARSDRGEVKIRWKERKPQS
jgi:hypothetical protein